MSKREQAARDLITRQDINRTLAKGGKPMTQADSNATRAAQATYDAAKGKGK